MKDYNYILFDWNGTLVDDLEINLSLCNILLSRRALPPVERDFYLAHFNFPIRPFYDLLGFDWEKEDYEDVAVEYGEIYASEMEKAFLFDDVVPVLTALRSRGKELAIISASMQERLNEQSDRLGVSGFFSDRLGAKDNLGESKVERCRSWLRSRGAEGNEVLFVGDTVHDAETAFAAGCDCVLISRGHNSTERLLSVGCPVFGSLAEAFEVEK